MCEEQWRGTISLENYDPLEAVQQILKSFVATMNIYQVIRMAIIINGIRLFSKWQETGLPSIVTRTLWQSLYSKHAFFLSPTHLIAYEEFPFHNFAYFQIITEIMGKTPALSTNYSRKYVSLSG
jgi:hypothetical protein